MSRARELVRRLSKSPSALRRHGLTINADGVARSASELLAYPGIDLARLAAIWPELAAIPADIAEQIEIDGRYAGYLERQEQEIEAFRRDESLALPRDLDYAAVGSLSAEIRLKLVGLAAGNPGPGGAGFGRDAGGAGGAAAPCPPRTAAEAGPAGSGVSSDPAAPGSGRFRPG